MASLLSCFACLFPRSLQTQAIQSSSTDISSIPAELILNIFLNLPSASLVRCSSVCHLWHQVVVENQTSFYLKFEAGMARLSKKSFSPDAFYAFWEKIPKEHLERMKEDPTQLIDPFPSADVFANDRKALRSFPYQEKRDFLFAVWQVGILPFEEAAKNRFLSLAAFFGDIEVVDLHLKKIDAKILPDILKSCLFVAVEGKQPAMIRALKTTWKVSPRESVLFNFNILDFAREYPEMVSVLEEDLV